MSNKIQLGKTSIMVPRICIGTGTCGIGGSSQQAIISKNEYAEILCHAFNNGLNFWDTSDDYGTHPHIKETLLTIHRNNVVLSTKSHAKKSIEIRNSINRSLKELGTDHIDILFMHEVDTLKDLENRKEALLELHLLKNEGIIKSVGLSTHSYAVLKTIENSPLVEIILTNFNKFEDHMDAGLEAYSKALQTAYSNGKGILVMKALGEGRLVKHYNESLKYNLSQSFIHSTVIGITKQTEVTQLLEFCCLFPTTGL